MNKYSAITIILAVITITGCVTRTDDAEDGEVCTPNWQCTSWSECIEGEQSRTCVDINACEIDEGKPAEIQTCQVQEAQPACADIGDALKKAKCYSLEKKDHSLCLNLNTEQKNECLFEFVKLNSVYNDSFSTNDTVCNNITDNDLRLMCKAITKLDTWYCDRLSTSSSIGSPSTKNNCYKNLALVTKNTTYCNNATNYRVNDSIIVNYCIEFIAYLSLNESLCDEIVVPIKELALENVTFPLATNETDTTITNREVSLCKDKIRSARYSLTTLESYVDYRDAICKAKYERDILGNNTYARQLTGYSSYNCILKIAGIIKDKRICDTTLMQLSPKEACYGIATGNITYCYDSANVEDCIKKIAKYRRDLSVCYESINYDACISEAALIGDPVLCEELGTDSLKNTCYNEAGMNELNTTYCLMINGGTIKDNCIFNTIRMIHLNSDAYFWVKGYDY